MGDGKKLKQMLKERDYSVTRLSRESGIRPTTLYTIIKKDTRIQMDFLIRIAHALKMDPMEFCLEFDIMNDFKENRIPMPETVIAGYSRMLDTWERERQLAQSLCTLTIIGNEAILQRMDSLLTCYSKLSEQEKAEVDQYVKERGLLRENERIPSSIG